MSECTPLHPSPLGSERQLCGVLRKRRSSRPSHEYVRSTKHIYRKHSILAAECRCARGWWCLTQVSELHGEQSPASAVLTGGPLGNLKDWREEVDFSRSTSGLSQACLYRGVPIRQTKKALLLEGPQEASLGLLSGCMGITHIQSPHGLPQI